MAFQLLLNFFIAIIWMFVNGPFSAKTFIIGYLIGLILIIIARRFFSERLYFFRLWSMIKLIFLFLKELISSNIAVLKVVLRPKLDIQPMIFALPIDLEENWEITLLSNLITLTPGTLVMHVSDDQKTLYVHALDDDDVNHAIYSIKNTFEKAIKEVSR